MSIVINTQPGTSFAVVLDVITEALVTIKALAVGETVPPDMANDALIKFNDVLESLSLQNLAVYQIVRTAFPLVGGTAQYTIGPTGAVVTERPSYIDLAYVTNNGVDTQVEIHTAKEYSLLSLKTQPGIPIWATYDQTYPNGTITLWPVPDQAYTLTVLQNKQFTNAATLVDSFDFPPGYRRMIRLLLAWDLQGDYPGMNQAEVAKLQQDANTAVALVKRNTKKPEMLRSEVAELDCSGGSNYSNWRDGA